IGVIIVVGFALGAGEARHFVGSQTAVGGTSLSDILTALVAGLFAFGGWHMVTYNAEETVEPERTIPRALLLGTLI
ncbi:MAG: amino acid permease, partial [Gemmatimonadetes bacterium]|nr:amino acid permease [Gemmatimonadota bacterium]NIS03173.1 amino acid permease [Gemmatimonadota bacterium]NIT69070.1 amino acid permease [Gemmatimonadota bacterium]NIU54298.1 amino acid permease [Gemmatimonadota bacterium]NIV25555.1 amino acid permease [Gemmatimonadota bacterium]